MGIYEAEDVRGAYVYDKVVCVECLTDKENDELKEDKLVTTEEIEKEDKRYFCDRCGKEL